MRIPKQASLILPFLLICLFQSNINAQGFLKNFLSNSLIKEGKQFKSDGKFPSAITKFTKSIKRNPENLEAYYQLGLIFEEVMHDYDKAISLFKNVNMLSEGINPVGTDEELKEFNSLITNARTGIGRVIGQKFESIEKPKIPVYIMVKPYQKISKEPKLLSFSIHKTTSYASEFKLLEYSNNWYQINVPSTGKGWVNGKDILKIIQKDEKAIETSPAGKAALYHRFVDQYPESRFAQNAKDKADDIYYGLAKEEGSINSYSMYLKENPKGKYSEEVQLKKDELTFEDEGFLNNINRLRQWITNNPESTFIEKAKSRIDELAFAQAKYDNNTVSLEGYIIDYPVGKFVPEAKQLLEDLKYNQAKFNDTVASYGKYLDEYPEGKYADAAARRVDGKKFSALLNSQNIELLVGHLGKETNKERKELVKKRVEELHFKKADGVNNDVEAIKMYEDYLQKYQDGLYVKDANARIEALSFNIALSKDNLESLKKFLKTYPNGKFAQNAKNRIEEIAFNGTKHVDTIDGYRNFIREYPDGVFSPQARNRIEGLAFEDAKTKNTTTAYKGFIAEYPDSHLTKTAKNIIEAGYFENARLKGTVKAYNEYIELYPDGSHLVESQLMIDELTFEPYRVKGSVGGFEKFIKKYPDNRYVKDAMARVDRLNFEYYKKKNTLKAYKKFVNKYPDNRYVSEAKQNIIQLQTSNIGGKSYSGFPYFLTIIILLGIGIIVMGVLMRNRIVTTIQSWRQGSLADSATGLKEKLYGETASISGQTIMSRFMSRKRITLGIVSLVISLITILLIYFLVGSNERLPEVYGVYAKNRGSIIAMEISGTSPILKQDCKFIVFDNTLANSLVKPEQVIRLYPRRFVRNKVEHIYSSPEALLPTRINVSDAGYFDAFNPLIKLAFAPVEGHPGMVKILPSSSLEKGLYYLEFEDQRFAFSINTPQDHNLDQYSVDKHYSTVYGNVAFSWGKRISLKTQKGLYGNQILKEEHKPINELTKIRDELKQSALHAIRQNQFTTAIIKTESYETIQPSDTSLRTTLSQSLVQAAQEALKHEDWAAAAVYADVADEVDYNTEMQAIKLKALKKLNNYVSAEQRLELSKKPKKTVWTSNAGEQLRLTRAPLDVVEGVSTSFRITDVGIFGSFGEVQKKYTVAGDKELWFGKVSEMKKVNKYTALFSSSKGPAIHILSGRRVKFEFASTKRRDECFKILEKAVIEWRVNNCLGDISVTSIPGGKLHYKISLLAGAWTPDVVFSSHLRVDNRTVSAGSYRLWNTSTGETISRRDIINASERGNLENLIPQGVPIRFTNSEIVPKAVNSIEVIFNRVYGNVDKIELEYILP